MEKIRALFLLGVIALSPITCLLAADGMQRPQEPVPDLDTLSANPLDWDVWAEEQAERDDAALVPEDMSEIEDQRAFSKRLNLSNAQLSDFIGMPCIRSQQIQAWQAYVKLYGYPKAWHECLYIPYWDEALVQCLQTYAYIGSEPEARLKTADFLKRSRLHWMMRYQWNGAAKATSTSTDPQRQPLGGPGRKWMRIRYQCNNRLEIGLTAENDPGEPFFSKASKSGFDAWSAFVAWRDWGPLKLAVVGHYRLRFGEGLALSTGAGFGASLLNAEQATASGLTPYASAGETGFLHGVATHFQWKRVDLYAFYGRTPIDGTIAPDAVDSSRRVLTTIKTDGLHRSLAEIATHRVAHQQMYGIHADFRFSTLRLGLTTFHQHLSIEYQPQKPLYAQASTPRTSGSVVAIDWAWMIRNVALRGEWAFSENGAWAAWVGLSGTLQPALQWSLRIRSYSPQYRNFFAHAIGQQSMNANEQGISANFMADLGRGGRISWGCDLFRFPKISYRCDAPSKGTTMQALWETAVARGRLDLMLRYRLKYQNGEAQGGLAPLVPTQTLSVRARYRVQIIPSVELSHRLEWRRVNKENAQLFLQDWAWTEAQQRVQLRLRWAVFHVPSFNTRFFVYEDDVLYAFSSKMYVDKGFRAYALLRYNLGRHWSFWFKYGTPLDMTVQVAFRW